MNDYPHDVTDTPAQDLELDQNLAPMRTPYRYIMGFSLGVMLVLFAAIGALLIGLGESAWLLKQPGAQSLLAVHPEVAWEGSYPVQARRISLEDTLEADPFLQDLGPMLEGEDVLELFGGHRTEMVLSTPLESDLLEQYLAYGRLPEPGKPEVLAGDLARFDSFQLDGVEFEVVGWLHPTVAAALYAYVLPQDDAWDSLFAAEETRRGVWIPEIPEDSEALSTYLMDLYQGNDAESEATEEAAAGDEEEVEESAEEAAPEATPEVPSEADEEDAVSATSEEAASTDEAASETSLLENFIANPPEDGPTLRGGQVRTLPMFAWTGIALLMLSAFGGALAMYAAFGWCAHSDSPKPLKQLSRLVLEWRSVYFGVHLLLYGVLFATMWIGYTMPLQNYWLSEFVAQIFSEGDLKHVGDAYASGNILSASWATFYNNYVVQTLGMVYAISLLGIPLGLFKTAFSFGLVGFVMTPTWAGQLVGYSYHSITMVLELQAYVLACFAVVMWPVLLLRGLSQNRFKPAAREGGLVLLNSALLVGGLLLFAALYEATTLILMSGGGGL